ncbi:L-cysteine:1D-myo-inositol 2-amino-2-deoxy-alpha-D-glucopyranoside ligase [Austwickia sp. TVS 96-490-7B]|uniref:cysteine--1-D-myo-inosityl 2-amino-2-deoxy-alpha-D-glucopyranoside ligase n=1 Tax=Austwickia sp. TVS 96-490-7B TaxID=2830843 RepID=UPI001C56B8DE|nr:cysteine--1-D-myo-inosityl 2-amino-2-deoxy-alpha-D-glucopyranoside ligase [Austwickia sp. TVS 96-490-7B]MBW3086246.1 L-cysteine:1D-myo-inositol 2-amino-2-deoxy-alpha-D-glucopyranoside ligase [Austwickia sp. TVS 96-490-7B]
MIAWETPDLPSLPETAPLPTVRDTHRGPITLTPGPTARMYVCGITPYDATHMGHAATYVTFDILGRLLRDTGRDVTYAQNVTDIDDPLLERATRDGVDWRDLATSEIQLFRDDMTALRVIPPNHFVGVVESIDTIAAHVATLLTNGAAYRLPVPDDDPLGATPDGNGDIYLDITARPEFGAVSGWDANAMDAVFADRGGDPHRPGKRHRFDPLLWRAARHHEPSWPSESLGAGRPGWHIECTTIALNHLGMGFDVQGGGTDLVFPHHEMSATQAAALHHHDTFAQAYLHQAMVGYNGHKMSKSRGNLVLVSRLRAAGENPNAIRLALLNHHHGTDWEWTDHDLTQARHRLNQWAHAATLPSAPDAHRLLNDVRHALADDLNTPRALTLIDTWTDIALAGNPHAENTEDAPALMRDLVDALLGVDLPRR